MAAGAGRPRRPAHGSRHLRRGRGAARHHERCRRWPGPTPARHSDHQRLPPRLHRGAALDRPSGRPGGHRPGVRRLPGRVRGRLGGDRHRPRPPRGRRRPGAARPGRWRAGASGPGHGGRPLAAGRPGPSPGRHRGPAGAGQCHRAPLRGGHRGPGVVAGHLLDQPPHHHPRRRRLLARPPAHSPDGPGRRAGHTRRSPGRRHRAGQRGRGRADRGPRRARPPVDQRHPRSGLVAGRRWGLVSRSPRPSSWPRPGCWRVAAAGWRWPGPAPGQARACGGPAQFWAGRTCRARCSSRPSSDASWCCSRPPIPAGRSWRRAPPGWHRWPRC